VIIEYLVGGGLVASGYFAGALITSLHLRRTPKRIEAICPCKHSVAFHKDLTGPCHGIVDRIMVYNASGKHVGYNDVACTCQGYAGPELISSLTMRPIAELPQATEEA